MVTGSRSSVRSTGHGRMSWMVKDPGHSLENIAAPKKSWRRRRSERRWYEEAARRRGWKPESQPQKCLGRGHTGSVAKPGRRTAPTSCAHRGARETGQAPCYAVKRTVSPVRVHSPVRYIPAPRIGRARVSIEPSAMKPALRIWSPVRLLGLAYMHGVPGSPA